MKFEGDNPFNNRVYVDFKRKHVSFEPVKGSHTIITLYVMFLYNCIMLMIGLLIIPMIILDLIITNLGTMLATFGIIVGFLLSLIYFNKTWRKEKYPKTNHKMITLITKIFSFGIYKEKKKLVLSKSLFQGKYFLIPKFKNIMLEYKLKGDFAKQIKDIRIDNLFKDDPFEWYCVIEFYKKPLNGSMELAYA